MPRTLRLADELDAAIVRLLSENGRLSNREIARRLGATEATVRRRVARLLRAEGFRIAGDFGGAARQTQMVFFVHTQPGRRIEAAERLIARQQVDRVALITGAYDLVVFAAFDSDAEALTFLVNELEGAADVASVQPGHVLKQFTPAGVRGLDAERTATARPDAALRHFLVRAMAASDFDSVVDLACDAARRGFGVQDAAVYLRDGTRPARMAMYGGQALAAEIDRHIQEEKSRPDGARAAAMLGQLMSGHVHVYVEDAAADPVLEGLHEIFREAGVRTMLYLPLLAGERRLGMLALYNIARRRYADDEIALAQALADQLTIAITRSGAWPAERP